jgi:hypothetical protein
MDPAIGANKDDQLTEVDLTGGQLLFLSGGSPSSLSRSTWVFGAGQINTIWRTVAKPKLMLILGPR